MSNFNKVILVGRLSADPILSYTQSGKPVTKFAIAINRKFTNKAGDKKEEVDFVNITVWDKQAESAAEWLAKGKLALIEGRLKQERWTNKEGKNRTALTVTANVIRFLSPSASMKPDLKDDVAQEDPQEEPVESLTSD